MMRPRAGQRNWPGSDALELATAARLPVGALSISAFLGSFVVSVLATSVSAFSLFSALACLSALADFSAFSCLSAFSALASFSLSSFFSLSAFESFFSERSSAALSSSRFASALCFLRSDLRSPSSASRRDAAARIVANVPPLVGPGDPRIAVGAKDRDDDAHVGADLGARAQAVGAEQRGLGHAVTGRKGRGVVVGADDDGRAADGAPARRRAAHGLRAGSRRWLPGSEARWRPRRSGSAARPWRSRHSATWPPTAAPRRPAASARRRRWTPSRTDWRKDWTKTDSMRKDRGVGEPSRPHSPKARSLRFPSARNEKRFDE